MRFPCFIGSYSVTQILSKKNIELETNSAIAAPEISLIAKKNIYLGPEKKESENPLRIFATKSLTLKADVITVDRVILLYQANRIQIQAKKVIFIQRTKEEPYAFEVLKQFIDKKTTIETIKVNNKEE